MCTVFSLDESVKIKWYRGLDPRFELKEGRRYRMVLQKESPPGGIAYALTSKLIVA